MAGINNRDERLVLESSKTLQDVWTFGGIELKAELVRGIYDHSFEKLSRIQQRAILPITKGRDVVAQAQSGTGKTSAFCISILQSIDMTLKETQALVLSPTPESAIQIQSVILALGDYMNVQCHACIDGTFIDEDIPKLDCGQHVVSGTPGRVLDLIRRRDLRTCNIKMLVLDEVDELLSDRSRGQIYDIYRSLPPSTQVVAFSTTLSHNLLPEITTMFMSDPIRILLGSDELILDSIKQFFVTVEMEDWKFDTLCDLFDTHTIGQTVVFCNTPWKVEWLTGKMWEAEFSVTPIHEDMDLEDRDASMQEFRSGLRRVLITTELQTRGIEMLQVSLVVNYDFPWDREAYVRRIGRSSCFGRKGVAISLVTICDTLILRNIEQFYGTIIDEMPVNAAELI